MLLFFFPFPYAGLIARNVLHMQCNYLPTQLSVGCLSFGIHCGAASNANIADDTRLSPLLNNFIFRFHFFSSPAGRL